MEKFVKSETIEPNAEKPLYEKGEEKVENFPKITDEDIEKRKENDKQKINEILTSIGDDGEKKESNQVKWKTVRKPESEWKIIEKDYVNNPIDKIKRFISSLGNDERIKNKLLKESQEQFLDDYKKHKPKFFNYFPGDGVVGRVGGKDVGIMAEGFKDCSALVLQTNDKVVIIHLSPITMNSSHQYGEVLNVRQSDYISHIKGALKQLIENNKQTPLNLLNYTDEMLKKLATRELFEKTTGINKLDDQEMNKMQKMIDDGLIRSTLIAGEDQFVPNIVNELASNNKSHGLPSIRTEAHYVRDLNKIGGDYSVYATTENIYIKGQENKILKKGVNFPPTMFDFVAK